MRMRNDDVMCKVIFELASHLKDQPKSWGEGNLTSIAQRASEDHRKLYTSLIISTSPLAVNKLSGRFISGSLANHAMTVVLLGKAMVGEEL